MMAGTPRKLPNKSCISCLGQSNRFYCLAGEKVSSETNFVEKFKDFCGVSLSNYDLPHLFICRPCWIKFGSSIEFKKLCSSNALITVRGLQRPKRAAKSPLGLTPKRTSGGVSCVQKSLEKLKLHDQPSCSTTTSRRALFEDTSIDKSMPQALALLPEVSISDKPSTSCEVPHEHEDDKTGEEHQEGFVLLEHQYSTLLPDNLVKASDEHDEHSYAAKTLPSAYDKDIARTKARSDAEKLVTQAPPEKYKTVANEIVQELRGVSRKKHSVLFQKEAAFLEDCDVFAEAVCEMAKDCQMLFSVLFTALGDGISVSSKIATLAAIYGMILHSNNSKISAMQRLFTTAAVRYHADVKLLSILNKVHITLSDKSKDHVLDSYTNLHEDKLIQALSSGWDGRLNGDNLDLRVTTNDVRMTNPSKDYHFFATDFVLDRVYADDLPDTMPQRDIDTIPPELFLPNDEEISKYKGYLKILLGRKLVEFVPAFSWMKTLLPTHIPHDHQEAMSRQSSIFLLPIILKNKNSLADCVDIMDVYVQKLNSWYTKAGRGGDLENLRIPVGGDQLTRVRLQAAKALREGTHTNPTRFDQLEPIVIEMFHTLQDFLEKLCKKFLKLNKGKDKGTMGHLKMETQRTNVNGQVKVRFKAHEQFVDLVGTSYFLRLVMDKFGLDDLDGQLDEKDVPKAVSLWHKPKKEELFNRIFDEILDAMFIPPLKDKLERPSSNLKLRVTVGQQHSQMTVPVKDNRVSVPVGIPGQVFILSVSQTQVEQGISVPVPGLQAPVRIELDQMHDDLNSYAINFMNWYFVLLVMKDITSEGNLCLTNITLKFMIPFFYSHSVLSKYMTECVDYILKTEIMMSERMALKVRAGSFVNPTGRPGHNKAADMQKENQVLHLKELIRGLGANKTEKSIVKISKVAPAIRGIAHNVALMTDSKDFQTRHKARSVEGDIKVVLQVLKKVNPWKVTEGRVLEGFRGMSPSPFCFNKEQLKTSINTKVARLKKGVMIVEGEGGDEDESEGNNEE